MHRGFLPGRSGERVRLGIIAASLILLDQKEGRLKYMRATSEVCISCRGGFGGTSDVG